jgi:hypothetical protein
LVASSGWFWVAEVAVGATDELTLSTGVVVPELDRATTTARAPEILGRALSQHGNSLRSSVSLFIMVVCILVEGTTEEFEEFLAPQ